MFDLSLSESDNKWLRENYPELKQTKKNGIWVLSGKLSFDLVYLGERICDTYDVRIEFRSSSSSHLPKVFETEMRIEKMAEEKEISLKDLHINSDGSACLCLRWEEQEYFPNGFSIKCYMEDLVEPFFYAQSYYKDFDRWPIEAYSHGVKGWLEWYSEKDTIAQKDVTDFVERLRSRVEWNQLRALLIKEGEIHGTDRCFCGSSKMYIACHMNVFLGITRLKQHIRKFEIDI